MQRIQTTSESSLDTRNSTTFDFMNDSGIGTIYDFRTDDFCSLKIETSRITSRKRHSLASNFKPKQQPSYMSTDDYLSQLADSEQSCERFPNLFRSYDGGESSNIKYEERQPSVVAANRRAELEWTLNKLINFELKYTWLTGQDTLRRGIRKIGVPHEIRAKVWLILIEQLIGAKYDVSCQQNS